MKIILINLISKTKLIQDQVFEKPRVCSKQLIMPIFHLGY